MKKRIVVLTSLLVCGAQGMRGGIVEMEWLKEPISTVELKNIKKLSTERNIASLAAEAVIKTPLKGLRNSIGEVGKSLKKTYDALRNPIRTVSHLAVPETFYVAKPLVKIALKPLKQIHQAYKAIRYSNSDKAAQREIDKIMEPNIIDNSYDDKGPTYYMDQININKDEYGTTLPPDTEKIRQKFDAAKRVADQASLGVKLFKRNALKKAMKEAISNVDKEDYQNQIKK